MSSTTGAAGNIGIRCAETWSGRCLDSGSSDGGKRGVDHPGVMADALEALIGAIFIDGGYAAVVLGVERVFAELLADIAPQSINKDAKTALQEFSTNKDYHFRSIEWC
ncbi:MAG: hypothetical protein CM1200mP41_17850 [Gammaproteobacteria bacterium]|nr:MAG: hypothetical protein CM1200mP41_17850 [Gammaproteobacteria bacterium]